MTTAHTIIVNEDNYSLLPFTFIVNTGIIGTGTELAFTIDTAGSSLFDYSVLIQNNSNTYAYDTTVVPTTYVPQPEGYNFEHRNEFFIDVIAKDNSGISQINSRFDPNRYQLEDVGNSFMIPKFEWDANVFSDVMPSNYKYWVKSEKDVISSDTNVSSNVFGFLIGDETGNMYDILYDGGDISIEATTALNSAVHQITFVPQISKLLVSTVDNLYSYYNDYYLDRNDRILLLSNTNSTRATMMIYEDGQGIWVAEPYNGNVSRKNHETLTTLSTVSNMDAPRKIIESTFHNALFIAGTHILWKWDSNNLVEVYEANNYEIRDFDVAPTGEICILLHSNNEEDVARVLESNLYSFKFDQRFTSDSVRACKYVGNDQFYILIEGATTVSTYKSFHYIVNVRTGDYSFVVFDGDLAVTTTTTTLGITTSAVEVTFPNGSEQFELGTQEEITWISSKSLTDFVKIDLYKGGLFSQTIVSSTLNTGIFEWDIPSNLTQGSNYKIAITWFSASSDPSNMDLSDGNFSISSVVPTTTTTTTTKELEDFAIGIDYDYYHNQILIVLDNGQFGIFNISQKKFYGLFDTGISDLISMAVENNQIVLSNSQTKVRIFVGSEERLSDRWDSGIIETTLTSMYYGGGDNLKAGERYYVSIQIYSDFNKWSEIQTKEFIMPK